MNASGLDQTKLNQLKDLLSKQVDILTRGMKIHAKIRPTNLEALHTQLESKKQTNMEIQNSFLPTLTFRTSSNDENFE